MEVLLTSKTAVVIYIIVGLCLAFYWYNKEYKNDYDKMKAQGIDPEDGILNILMCYMVIFWPTKLFFNLIVLHRI